MKVTIGTLDPYKLTYPLSIDGDVWRTVHVSIFGKSPKFPEASQQEIEEKFAELERKGTKNFLLRRLAMKNYHSVELIEALEKRGVNKETSLLYINEFSHLGYLNDSAWVSSRIRLMRQQRFGFKAIAMKLRQKGLEEQEVLIAIQAVKEQEGEEDNERASISRLLETKYRTRDLSNWKERQKVVQALIRKGFSFDDVFAVLKVVD